MKGMPRNSRWMRYGGAARGAPSQFSHSTEEAHMHPLRTALITSTLLAALPFAANAQASNRFERGSWEIDEQIENPCNGELVQITGTYTVTSRRNIDANGRVHFSATTNTDIR